MSTTRQIYELARKYGLDYETAGPCECVAVHWRIDKRAWEIADDWASEYVKSLEEAEEVLKRWSADLQEANEGM